MRDSNGDTVLVTGASGFIAKHIVAGLLAEGYLVRGSVRSDGKAAGLRATMQRPGLPAERLETVKLDLTQDDGWTQAAAGCRYVMHTASPFPAAQPKDKFGLVGIAKGGTVRLCNAASAAGAERIVLTSSIASIVYGHPGQGTRSFDERTFSNVESPHISPYAVSKTLAEQAAWETMQGSETSLTAINPSLVLGPVLDAETGTSAKLVAMMMNGRLPMIPNVRFGVVDVRDVAAAHLAAMREPEAAGRRFIASSGSVPLKEIAAIIGRAYPDYAGRLRSWTLPDWTVKLAARVSRQAAMLAAEIGSDRRLVTRAAEETLGIRFRPVEEAVTSLADSLIRFGQVTPSGSRAGNRE